ncbi:DUF3165 family protein [Streptococcus thoraltensis]|uniref:DUF3165 family protein n=1 Tax=Streptococcus thoraltensis TaxID=55085 RepID=UPI00036F4525|nr:DUF3165 family protein [Streptococcus thoraltensis]MDY4762003.1 DUF3165 family protein [Streptococcus thoraltensis]
MFYLLVLLAIVLYYFFMAPKTIRNTINSIVLMAVMALLLILAGMSFMKLIQSPGEVYIIAIMLVFGFLAIRDVIRLSSRPIQPRLPFKKEK